MEKGFLYLPNQYTNKISYDVSHIYYGIGLLYLSGVNLIYFLKMILRNDMMKRILFIICNIIVFSINTWTQTIASSVNTPEYTLSNTASAQGYASGAATIIGTVTEGLTIDGSEVALGDDLTQGQCYTLSPDGFRYPPVAGAETDVVNDAPLFILTGNPYDFVEVELILPAFMYGDAGSRISLSTWTYGYNFDGGGIDAGFINQGPVTGPFLVEIGTATSDIYVGVKACVPTGAMADGYLGTVIAEAHYIVQP